MERKTFDPISEPYTHMPQPKPGWTIVSFSGDRAQAVSGNSDGGLRQKFQEIANPQTLIIFISVLVISGIFLGIFASIIVILILVGGIIFIYGDRGSNLSQLILGASPTFYMVDGSRREIIDGKRLQLKNTGVYAEIHFEYMAQVSDVEKVVLAGVRDVREHLSHTIYAEIGKLASSGSLDDKLLGLRAGLLQLARNGFTDDIFEISNITFEVHAEGKIAGELEKIAEHDLRIKGIDAERSVKDRERQYYEAILADDEKLFAEMMRPGSDMKIVTAALRAKMERSGMEYNQKLALLKTAMDQGILEPHHIESEYPQFMAGLMDTLNQLTSGQAGLKSLSNDGAQQIEDNNDIEDDAKG